MTDTQIFLAACTCLGTAFFLVVALFMVLAVVWYEVTGSPLIAVTGGSSTASQQWGERLVYSDSDPTEFSIRSAADRYRQQAERVTDNFQSDTKDFIDSWR